MRVLIACEYSGIVRDAFSIAGHDAWSCDLLETEIPGKHIKDDVLKHLDDGWDLMIGHPPCTYLSYAGMQSWNNPGRVYKRLEALKFFADLWEAPITKICLENPKGCASPAIAKYSQEIQPYYFGDSHLKTTWLWLKNLPKLQYDLSDTLFNKSTAVKKPDPILVDSSGHNRYYADAKIRNPYERSRFWNGIAAAMANQWSDSPKK
jgi:hypothetical protein